MKLSESKFPFADAMLKGMGQIMLQESALTGLLFLAGIFYGGIHMGMAAILAVFCGTLTAKILGYDQEEIASGRDGFSAALVGVALMFYFQPVLIVWIAVVFGSALATILQHGFILRKISVFTLPFVLVTWIVIYVFHHVYPVGAPVSGIPKMPEVHNFTFALRGFGQVIFQGSAIAGFIFFIAVFVHSPVAALYGIAGSVLGAMLALGFSMPVEGIEMGLFGYNAVLCAIAFSGEMPEDGIWALVSIAFSVLISVIMSKHGLVILTFPFVAGTCATLVFKKHIRVLRH